MHKGFLCSRVNGYKHCRSVGVWFESPAPGPTLVNGHGYLPPFTNIMRLSFDFELMVWGSFYHYLLTKANEHYFEFYKIQDFRTKKRDSANRKPRFSNNNDRITLLVSHYNLGNTVYKGE